MDERRRCVATQIRDVASRSPTGVGRIQGGYAFLADTCGITSPDNARYLVERMTLDGELIKVGTRQFISLDPEPERRALLDQVVDLTKYDKSLVARVAFLMQRGWSTDRVCGALGEDINLDCNVIAVLRGALGHLGYLRVE